MFIDGMVTIPSISRSLYVVYGIVLPTLLCLTRYDSVTAYDGPTGEMMG